MSEVPIDSKPSKPAAIATRVKAATTAPVPSGIVAILILIFGLAWYNQHYPSPSPTPTPTTSTTSTSKPTTTAPSTSIATTTSKSTTTSVAPPTTTTTIVAPPTTTPALGTAYGQTVNASNTGYHADGVTLTPSTITDYGSSYSGTASTPSIISRQQYTSTVTISGNYITLRDCGVTVYGNNSFGIKITGSHDTVDHCTVGSPDGTSIYEPIYIDTPATFTTITRTEIFHGENAISTYGSNVLIQFSYMHDPSNVSTGGHPDGIEVFEGHDILIDSNRIVMLKIDDGVINAAPYRTGESINRMKITGNLLDGASHLALIDLQSSGSIQNTQVTGNAFGGHQYWSGDVSGYGPYHALLDSDGRGTVTTDAALAAAPNKILWPISGIGENVWGESQDLSPNRNGQVALPAY